MRKPHVSNLTPERRREIASGAAKARWAMPRAEARRLSESVDGKFWLYARGFRDGAGQRAIDKAKAGLGPYDLGVLDGQKAAREACERYAREIGYVPEILRVGR